MEQASTQERGFALAPALQQGQPTESKLLGVTTVPPYNMLICW